MINDHEEMGGSLSSMLASDRRHRSEIAQASECEEELVGLLLPLSLTLARLAARQAVAESAS